MKKPAFLISCPIFEDELNAVLPTDEEITVHFMDCRIHNNPRRLKEELVKGIAETQALGGPVRLLVGSGCHCDVGIGDLPAPVVHGILQGKTVLR